MLRITQAASDSGTRLILEGKIVGPWVAELRTAFQNISEAGRPPELDLAGVSYVDDAGERLLRELIAEGAQLMRCSGFVRETLRQRNDR